MWKIKLNEGQKIFFTSDTHYNHTNICRGISKWGSTEHTRDFKTLNEMNYAIVKGINDAVAQDDILIHLGDWSFGGFESIKEFRDKIICKNIYLIYGNHDHHIETNRGECQDLFVKTAHYTMLEIDNGPSFVLMHFPICSWHDMSRGKFHLFGHVHLSPEKRIMGGRSMDVGVEGHNLKPYEMSEVVRILSGRPVQANVLPLDHHEKNKR